MKFYSFILLSITALVSHAKKPNFVIIFNDDMGYADLGCFGADKIKTPRIDQMAKEGRKFTSFYVASAVCSASRAALLTGCYPMRVGVRGVFFPNRGSHGLEPRHYTIAELLKSAGYKTLAAGKWHLGDEPKFLPTNQGFDTFYGVPYSNDMYPAENMKYAKDCLYLEGMSHETIKKAFADAKPGHQPKLKDKVPLMRDEECIEFPLDQRTITRRIADESIRFIKESVKEKKPFFVYLANPMPHTPLFVSKDFEGKSAGGIYGDVIEEIDYNTGRVLDTLKEQGVDDNTLVIFTSDNGPWLIKGDHGGSAKPLRDGKGSSYEGGQRVPCVMRWPGKISAGTECNEVATAMDMLPTFSAISGIKLPADLKLQPDGHNIENLIIGGPEEKTPYTTFYYSNNSGVRSGPWKYRAGRRYGNWAFPRGEMPKDNPQEKQLFHLIKDIGETKNVIDQHPEIAERLVTLIAQSPNHTMKLFKTGKPKGERYEFEKGKVSGGATAGGKHVGGMQNLGASVTIEVDGGKKGGEFLMTLGYACGGNASVALLVNGEKQTDLLLPTTGGWSTHKAAKVYLDLKPGKNQLLFRSQKKGGVNLDYFDLKPTTISTPSAHQEVSPKERERGMRIASGDLSAAKNQRERFYALGEAANNAMREGKIKRAQSLAEELSELASEYKDDWNYGNAIAKSNQVLGRIALSKENILEAKKHLLASAEIQGSPQLNSFGPDFILARELAIKGEFKTVLTFLDLIGRFWANPADRKEANSKNVANHNLKLLESWKKQLGNGQVPDHPKWR